MTALLSAGAAGCARAPVWPKRDTQKLPQQAQEHSVGLANLAELDRSLAAKSAKSAILAIFSVSDEKVVPKPL